MQRIRYWKNILVLCQIKIILSLLRKNLHLLVNINLCLIFIYLIRNKLSLVKMGIFYLNITLKIFKDQKIPSLLRKSSNWLERIRKKMLLSLKDKRRKLGSTLRSNLEIKSWSSLEISKTKKEKSSRRKFNPSRCNA